MTCKLVVSDIDGTLLTDDFKLLSSTEKAIKELVNSGVLFATASARAIPYTYKVINNLKDICCANAYVSGTYVTTSKGELLYDKPFSKEEFSFLLNQFNKAEASFCCVTRDLTFARVNHPEVARIFNNFSGEYKDISKSDISQIEAYFIIALGENLDSVADAASQLPEIEITSPMETFFQGIQALDIQKLGTGKEPALRNIAEYFGVDISQTMAIGDNILNDGPMIEAAGCGVAMKNASKLIIDKADLVTSKDNNNDGAGEFLRDYFGL